MRKGHRIGIDVGGTFTDGILIDEATGEIRNAKVPSTPRDPSEGFLDNLDAIISQFQVDPQGVWLLVHGTTVATNSIIEGKTAPTALIATRGFRDILEIAYQIRPKLYDVFAEKPPPLVPRDLCFEVTERIGPEGEIIRPLDESEVPGIADRLREKGIETVAICLLHSYVNDSHERRVAELLAGELSELNVTLSSVISPEFREYPRASTAVVNACIRPIVSRYVDRIEDGLQDRDVDSGFYMMQSNGGIVSSEISKAEPARIIESGPAAGIIIASHIAARVGRKDALCLDIGGTTAKVGMILDGQPRLCRELEVGAAAFSRSTARRASGYPLRMPSIDLVEIGAGGGSIAWIDSGGILRVGPQSAGADPGPACYPEGGDQPTLTDANLILGRLNPDYFLGGKMKLSPSRSVHAMREHCCRKLETDEVETSAAVVRLAVSNMVNAIRFLSVEKGYDPRDFCLIITGGAGPLHANLLADELGIPSVIIPPSPGVASALGLLISDIKHEVSATVLTEKNLDGRRASELLSNLTDEATKRLQRQGVQDREITLIPSMDMRYAGQSYELNVQFDASSSGALDLEEIRGRFDWEHERTYGFDSPGEAVEFVTLRATGLGRMPAYEGRQAPLGDRDPVPAARKEQRKAYFEQLQGLTECEVYDRAELLQNNRIEGPAVVEEADSTTVLLPGYAAEVDQWGNLIISPREDAR